MTARPDLAEIERQTLERWVVRRRDACRQIEALGTETNLSHYEGVLALLARVRKLEAALEWRSIESAPRDGTEILFGWSGDDHVEQGLWRVDAKMWMGLASGFWQGRDWPTHWQPLPPPPKEPSA